MNTSQVHASNAPILASMRSALSAPLSDFEQLSQTLLRSLAPPTTTHGKHPIAPSVASFLDNDESMAAALQQARIHQAKQRRIEELTEEVLELDARLRDVIGFLSRGRDELGEIIREGKERLEVMDVAEKRAVSHETLLQYASILAPFTSAPPTMNPVSPDQPFPTAFRPPFPTEEMMRRGKMNEEGPLGSLGETRGVGKVPTPSLLPDAQAQERLLHEQQQQQAALAMNGVPNQYSYHAPPQQTSGALDDLFDLDLNPDF